LRGIPRTSIFFASRAEKAAGLSRWYPTQAKTGLEWGTQP
jgi:hypothetical protein